MPSAKGGPQNHGGETGGKKRPATPSSSMTSGRGKTNGRIPSDPEPSSTDEEAFGGVPGGIDQDPKERRAIRHDYRRLIERTQRKLT